MELQTCDREHWLMIKLGIVQTIQKMDSTRAGRGKTHSQFACELCVSTGHGRSRFLMPNLNETNLVLTNAKRLHDPVNAVAGKTENDFDAPVCQFFNQYLCSCHSPASLGRSEFSFC